MRSRSVQFAITGIANQGNIGLFEQLYLNKAMFSAYRSNPDLEKKWMNLVSLQEFAEVLIQTGLEMQRGSR